MVGWGRLDFWTYRVVDLRMSSPPTTSKAIDTRISGGPPVLDSGVWRSTLTEKPFFSHALIIFSKSDSEYITLGKLLVPKSRQLPAATSFFCTRPLSVTNTPPPCSN